MINENILIEDFQYLASLEFRNSRRAEGVAKVRHKAKGDAYSYAAKKIREIAQLEERKKAQK